METQTMVERLLIFIYLLKNKKLTRSWPLDWRSCYGQGIKWDAPSFFWTLGLAIGGFTLWPSKSRGCGSSWPKVWTLGLTFGGSTLCSPKGSNSFISLVIFSLFLWALDKGWPFNPTASRLGRP
jgi:hypothetical protein